MIFRFFLALLASSRFKNAAALLLITATTAAAADRDNLLYHAETLDGRVLASRGADTPFNPASLVKVGPSLWALESLGAEHRYRTVFGLEGDWDKQTGRLIGSLVTETGKSIGVESIKGIYRKNPGDFLPGSVVVPTDTTVAENIDITLNFESGLLP